MFLSITTRTKFFTFYIWFMNYTWALTRIFLFLSVCTLMASCDEDESAPVHEDLLYAKRFDNPGIYDQDGRYMLIRGVNLNTLGDYWVGNPVAPATAPYEPDHFRIMAEYGFNMIRLVINWSAVEPQRGVYDQSYLDQIKRAIEDAAEYDIYVMIDMHQDAWGKYIVSPMEEECEFPNKGWDGAPEWATLTDGASTCTENGRRESAPAVYNAFRNFWLNTDGIQDAFIRMWQEVVKATASYPTVLGYDAFNEPSLGNGDYAAQGQLYNKFLRDLVEGIRAAERASNGYEHIFFFETTVTWAGQELPFTPSFYFTQDENIVFAPHNYFEVITQDLLTIEQGADLYQNLSNQYGTHCFIGEWGVFEPAITGLSKLTRFAAAEDKYFMGSSWWQWCQSPGDVHSINHAGDSWPETSMHLLEVAADGQYTGARNEAFLQILSRSRPIAIQGNPLFLQSDPETGEMTLRAEADEKGTTELWIPDYFGMPMISGNNVVVQDIESVEGGFRVRAEVEGRYEIQVDF